MVDRHGSTNRWWSLMFRVTWNWCKSHNETQVTDRNRRLFIIILFNHSAETNTFMWKLISHFQNRNRTVKDLLLSGSEKLKNISDSFLLTDFLLSHPIYIWIPGISYLHDRIKGIVRPFELGGETRFIRSTVINWWPGKFCSKILMKQSQERNKNHLVRLRDFCDGSVQSQLLFQFPESQFKNSYQFRLTTSWNRLSPEDGFRLLVSSNPLLRFSILTCQWRQIMVTDVPGLAHTGLS
jgi:hypothetical protein